MATAAGASADHPAQRANAARFAAIAALIEEWRPTSLVVGRPLSLDGTAHVMTARCMRFASQLRGRFGLSVEYAEERLSSVDAAGAPACRRDTMPARARKHLDAIAAQVILQSHFDGLSGKAMTTLLA
jgi:putative Holliday junction resolvase